MAATDPGRTFEEKADIAAEIYNRQVRPTLQPSDDNKFVAIDVETGDFEIDKDDYTVITRLRERHPEADIWLERVGQPTPYKLRRGR